MKGKQGFAPILIAVAVVAVVAVVGFVVMKGKGAPGAGGVLPQVKIPGTAGLGLNANCKLNDPELCRYMDRASKMAQNFSNGFVTSSLTYDKNGKLAEEAKMEISGDSYHMVTYRNGKEESNIINMKDAMYTKDMADGKWTKYEIKTTDKSSEGGLFNIDEIKNQFKDTIKETEDKTTYKAMGKEACGSMQCFKYQVISPLNTETNEFVYFDDQDYIMRKIRVEFKGGGATESMFEFKPVTISAPSPVKESQTQNSMFNPELLQKMNKTEGAASSIDTEEMKKLIEQMKSQSPGESQESVSSEAAGE